jgi:hypothetical protein
VLAAWSVFVWATRIRNALADDELGTGAKTVAVITAVVFTAGGLAVGIAALRRHGQLRPMVAALAVVTAVYWPVRIVQIVARDHSLGFTLVHAALGAVSVALALWAWPARRARVRPAGLLPGR